MTWINAHRKYLIAALSAILTAASVYGLSDKYVAVIVAVAGALGVYQVPNTPPAPPEAKP